MTSTERIKLKNKESIVVAFHKLLKAAQAGSEVLLLDKRDVVANCAVQEYNDTLSDTSQGTSYAQFVDDLAEVFARQAIREQTGQPKKPNLQQMQNADQMLSGILRSLTTESKNK